VDLLDALRALLDGRLLEYAKATTGKRGVT
jgi:hypothetical protein